MVVPGFESFRACVIVLTVRRWEHPSMRRAGAVAWLTSFVLWVTSVLGDSPAPPRFVYSAQINPCNSMRLTADRSRSSSLSEWPCTHRVTLSLRDIPAQDPTRWADLSWMSYEVAALGRVRLDKYPPIGPRVEVAVTHPRRQVHFELSSIACSTIQN